MMKNMTLIVTGASRGIGAATALLAATRGYAVCVNYLRNQAAAETVATQILANGGRAVAIQADVSDEASVQRLFTET
jgi:NAD(P)-dependent dehydrogenase (short-subunit alcohol dehydrogenase family)